MWLRIVVCCVKCVCFCFGIHSYGSVCFDPYQCCFFLYHSSASALISKNTFCERSIVKPFAHKWTIPVTPLLLPRLRMNTCLCRLSFRPIGTSAVTVSSTHLNLVYALAAHACRSPMVARVMPTSYVATALLTHRRSSLSSFRGSSRMCAGKTSCSSVGRCCRWARHRPGFESHRTQVYLTGIYKNTLTNEVGVRGIF
jgi:hypothetical protein